MGSNTQGGKRQLAKYFFIIISSGFVSHNGVISKGLPLGPNGRSQVDAYDWHQGESEQWNKLPPALPSVRIQQHEQKAHHLWL